MIKWVIFLKKLNKRVENMFQKIFFCLMIFCVDLLATETFIVKELSTNKIIQQKGYFSSQFSPCCTFNIALSLMGFDSGILQDENNPVWPYEESYCAFMDIHKTSHDPKSWMQHSCVWYSRVLTQKLGMEKFKYYVQMFNYGNQDVSGDEGKNNGLMHAWLSSSLKISPWEQLIFLEGFLSQKFPLSLRAYEMTRKILYLETLSNGWKFYGKTGTGFLSSDDVIGWFVGWITKAEKTYLIIWLLDHEKRENTFAGARAKKQALDFLVKLLEKTDQGKIIGVGR